MAARNASRRGDDNVRGPPQICFWIFENVLDRTQEESLRRHLNTVEFTAFEEGWGAGKEALGINHMPSELTQVMLRKVLANPLLRDLCKDSKPTGDAPYGVLTKLDSTHGRISAVTVLPVHSDTGQNCFSVCYVLYSNGRGGDVNGGQVKLSGRGTGHMCQYKGTGGKQYSESHSQTHVPESNSMYVFPSDVYHAVNEVKSTTGPESVSRFARVFQMKIKADKIGLVDRLWKQQCNPKLVYVCAETQLVATSQAALIRQIQRLKKKEKDEAATALRTLYQPRQLSAQSRQWVWSREYVVLSSNENVVKLQKKKTYIDLNEVVAYVDYV
jgi:hypothetical protein